MAPTSVEGRGLMAPRKATPIATGISQTPQGGLKLRPRIIVLSLSLIAGLLAVFVTEANAQCPPPTGFRYIGGTCTYTQGVDIVTDLNNTGKPQLHPKSLHAVVQQTGTGVLFCGTKFLEKPRQPPGQRLVVTTQTLTCSTPIMPTDITSTTNGGTATVTCHALLTPQALQALGDQFCSSGQIAYDFVPCTHTQDVTYFDDEKAIVIEAARFPCSLASCETLVWDKNRNLPELRQYQCTGPDPVP
jgi:hypothetical protein